MASGGEQAPAPSPSAPGHAQLVDALSLAVPRLTPDAYKGQAGKVGVLGGCREYTGAPFFAAMSALRMGCDLAYVFCAPSAAAPIKSYSPELIVCPVLRESGMPPRETDAAWQAYYAKCQGFIRRLSVLIIGPGLGDDPELEWLIADVIRVARQAQLPLIIDGSGLGFVAAAPALVQGYSNCLLTPNIAELGRLAAGAGLQLPGKIGTHWQQHAQELAAALDGPVVLSKGRVDVICGAKQQLVVMQPGSARRCGGQGDVLTGTIAAFVSWLAHAPPAPQPAGALPPLMLPAYGGCLAMRAAAQLAFEQLGRRMVAGDMLEHLGDAALARACLGTPWL